MPYVFVREGGFKAFVFEVRQGFFGNYKPSLVFAASRHSLHFSFAASEKNADRRAFPINSIQPSAQKVIDDGHFVQSHSLVAGLSTTWQP
jgi:hypothetical protein